MVATGRKWWAMTITLAAVVLFTACAGSGPDVSTPSLNPPPGPPTAAGSLDVPPARETPELTVAPPEQTTPAENVPPVQPGQNDLPVPVFSFSTIDGEQFRLGDLLGTAPVYVLFVPGVDGETDRRQVGDIQARFDQFEALGASVVVIASDLPTNVLRLKDDFGIEFFLIADPLNVIAPAWQAFDLFGGGKSGPASFIFDAHGNLIARLVAAEADDRPSVDEVLQVIRESLSAGAA